MKVIIIFAYIEKESRKYIIRVKDIDSNGIVSKLSLPKTDKFYIKVDLLFTRKQTNKVKLNPRLYRFFPKSTNFDYLEK